MRDSVSVEVQTSALDPLINGSYAVVVAHPDDEILWFGSVLENARRIILCYGDYAPLPSIGAARKKVADSYPHPNVVFLDLPEGRFHDRADWSNPVQIPAGMALIDSEVQRRYEANFALLVSRLEPFLQDVDLVFTHNPWGEYGHEDHVQMHQAVGVIASRRGIRMLVPAFSTPKSSKLMEKWRDRINPGTLTKRIDKSQVLAIKELYEKNGCWTYFKDWSPPDEDSFLSLKDGYPVQGYTTESSNVFQLLILDGGYVPGILPPVIAENVESVKATYRDARHRLLGGNEARAFIKDHFDSEVLATYDKLKPNAFKADLARYCLLYVFGGTYVDIGIRLFKRLEVPAGKGMAFFRDVTGASHTPWAVSNGVFHAKPGREELKLAIDLVVANGRQGYYGTSPLCPTGPVLFGRAFAALYKPEEYLCGEVNFLTPSHPEKNLGFVDPSGNLIAIRFKPSGTTLGLPGANNYSEIWHTRQVYGEQHVAWTHRDSAIRCKNDGRRGPEGIRVNADDKGFQVWGPYVSLEPGRYKAELTFLPGGTAGVLKLDVCSDRGEKIHAASPKDGSRPDADGKVLLEFAMERAAENVEVRVRSEQNFQGVFVRLEFVRLD